MSLRSPETFQAVVILGVFLGIIAFFSGLVLSAFGINIIGPAY